MKKLRSFSVVGKLIIKRTLISLNYKIDKV